MSGFDSAVTPDAGIAFDARTEFDASTLSDSGPDPLDASFVDAESSDAQRADVDPSDAGESREPVIIRMGSGGFLLRGTVLAPAGAIENGEVLVVGNQIACVGQTCAEHPMAASVTLIETHGVISAGLIDAHNHAVYDILGEWSSAGHFENRYVWQDDSSYEEHVRPVAEAGTRGSFVCPATKWAELRSLIHGTTTIMGQSPQQLCVDRLVRNADHYDGVSAKVDDRDTFLTTISSIRDIADVQSSGTDRSELIAGFSNRSITRYAVHMAEGFAGQHVEDEFSSYVGREPRTSTTRTYMIDLLHAAGGAGYGTAMFIHAVGLGEGELEEAIAADAKFVWSPSSNIVLYERTANIGFLLRGGAKVGLGPDWTVSGADEMLSEMRFALDWATASAVPEVTPPVLHRMATAGSAEAVGLEAHIGRLEVGFRADVSVFTRTDADPHRSVIANRAADVRLVLIDGLAYYGDSSLRAGTAINSDCETFDACGASKFICVANTPGSPARAEETLAAVETQLREYLMPYARELLPLVDCSL